MLKELINRYIVKIYRAKTQKSPSYLNFFQVFASWRALREVIPTKVDRVWSRELKKWQVIGLISAIILLGVPVWVLAATLSVDGNFDDWNGQANISDPAGDGPTPNVDMLTFYWGTNPDDDHIYWMMQRETPQSGNPRVYYFVFLDTNNNGSYGDSEDRRVEVLYDSGKDDSQVEVTVYTGSGGQISQNSGDWGDSANEGGARAEWRASFNDLGISPNQTINMYAGASQNQNPDNMDRVPDSGDITWSPVPVLGWIGLMVVIAGVIGLAWYTRGRYVW